MTLPPLTLRIPDQVPDGPAPGQQAGGLYVPLAELLQYFDVQLVPKQQVRIVHDHPKDPDALTDLQQALLDAADGEERARKSIILRARRQPTSCAYAALRVLLERGLLKAGAHGLYRP